MILDSDEEDEYSGGEIDYYEIQRQTN